MFSNINKMKKINLSGFLLIILAIAFSFSSVSAQVETSPDAPKKDFRPGERRPNLFRELGLTTEQTERIRQLNQNRKPLMQQAQRRVREATSNLDQVIYADAINESEIEARLKELQTAQADIARLRATGELEVRKILTAEQIVKFRDLRRRFAEMRENFNERRKDTLRDGNKNAPNRRFSRQLRKIPNN